MIGLTVTCYRVTHQQGDGAWPRSQESVICFPNAPRRVSPP
jgi:hypothetical protein